MIPPEPDSGAARVGPRWLMDEIGAFLAAPGASIEEQHAIARVALDNGRTGFETFVGNRFRADELVCAEIAITRACGHSCRFAFGVAPGPIALLVFCAANCADGDEVTLRQTTALAGSVSATESWPFGLACAEQMTIPASARLSAGSFADHA